MSLSRITLLPAILLALSMPLAAQEHHDQAGQGATHDAPRAAAHDPGMPAEAAAPAAAMPTDEQVIAAQKPSYPLTTCLVSDEALGGNMGPPVGYVYQGRYMEFCCADCKHNVEKEPAKFLAKLDAAVVAAQKPTYPLTTCVMSGETLGSKSVELVYGTRLVEFCCNDCKADFLKSPEAGLAKIDEALIAAQSASYAMTTCPVSGEKLEDPIEVLYGVQLVKFCCKQCVGEFNANPDKYMAVVKAAAAGRAADGKAAPATAPAREGHDMKDMPGEHEKPKGG